MPDQRVIYITGRGGDANKGLGAYLKTLDANRIGLSVNSQFLQLDFQNQVNVVSKLIGEFDSSHTRIIANSYGAYLCLHALIDAPSYLSHFLLLSPAIGAALNKQSLAYSRMPGCQRYDRTLTEKRLTKPGSLAIHIGDKDDGYDLQRFTDLCAALATGPHNVVENQGHTLDKVLIQKIVGQFLSMEAL